MATYLGTTINESPTINLEAGEDIQEAQGKAVIISGGLAITATAGEPMPSVLSLFRRMKKSRKAPMLPYR